MKMMRREDEGKLLAWLLIYNLLLMLSNLSLQLMWDEVNLKFYI
jgi:hypothetical protein